jgi:DNA gyrase/topoisomerase IV subunit B
MGKDYSAQDIDLLTDIEQIRKRPDMWVGDSDEVGHFVIFKEIFDNSLDEAICGHAKNIYVALDADGRGVTVEDDGRGIPFDRHEKSGISALATVFAYSKSGGKYNKGQYETSIGTHGVGSTCTNALSEVFVATSWRRKECATVEFRRGVLCGGDAVVSKTKETRHGTRVYFKPDYEEIFTSIQGYSAALIKERLLQAATLARGVNIFFRIVGEEFAKIESVGIAGLVGMSDDVNEHSLAVVETIDWEGNKVDMRIEVVWGWSKIGGEVFESFINFSRTKDGGQHLVGWQNALGDFLVERAKNKCTRQEIFAGLQCGIHVTHPGPKFSSQIKDKLTNKGLSSIIQDALRQHLKGWARRNVAEIDSLLLSAVAAYEEKEAQKNLKKAQKCLKLTRKTTRGILPAKLFEADCRPSVRELYIVEGDSAAGSAVRGRDASYQEVLPLKGKILNAFKATEADVLLNTEVAAVIAAVGGGFGGKFNVAEARVSKVILLSDGDHDGSHISSLILALFVKYMPGLLERGIVYMVDSPLFKGSLAGTKIRWFGYTMDDLKNKAGKDFKRCDITRLKGHGEANFDEVAEYAMNPSTRRLIQLGWVGHLDGPDIEKVMGDDVLTRKEILNVE